MKAKVSGLAGVVIGILALAIMTGPQLGAAQSQSPGATSTQTSTAAADQVTITGCIQREADYRRTTAAGRGGAAGTGVGVGNEFVLANAMMSTTGASATSGAGASTPTGTAGATSTVAYELTGPNEGQAATYVGKRVEIVGKMKPGDAATGGPTGAVPGSQDLKLRELEMSSIRETTGTCTTTP